MPTIAIGDIHGNLAALYDLLERVNKQLGEQDTVVFLGDYIDRGPHSRGCIDRILKFCAESSAHVVTLLGNHEDWLLKTIRNPTRHSWILGMEAFDTIASYSTDASDELRRAIRELGPRIVTEHAKLPYGIFLDKIPKTHLSFLMNLKPYYRTNEAVFVHGGINPSTGSVEEQDLDTLLWGVDGFPESYYGEDLIVYGHCDDAVVGLDGWPRPRLRIRAICVDTISHGVLTAIRLPDGCIIQSGRHDA